MNASQHARQSKTSQGSAVHLAKGQASKWNVEENG